MKVRYPDYYKKFRCIAGDCPDTCCAGWEIAVDRKSEKRYRDLRKQGKIQNREFAEKLKRYVKDGCILSEDVTCPFLNQDGLCEMYLELGPESLCHTCARHPRHLEDYGNLHEMVMLLSCPEVARLVLEEGTGGFYVKDIPDKQGDMEGIDEQLLDILLRLRAWIWKICKDHAWPMDQRMAFILAFAHDVQKYLSHDSFEAIEAVYQRYSKPDAMERFIGQWKAGSSDRNGLMEDLIREFSSLETICKDWPDMMKQIPERSGPKQENTDFEQVFSYYVYSFFLTSLYDGDVLTKVKMAVCCTMLLEELYAAEKEALSLEKRVSICHALARQIENSDGNRAHFEKMLKCETFAARRMINALL